MKEQNKTKQQLINELVEMRQRIAQLEAERKRVEEKLRALLLVDNLTGLHNRRGFLTLSQQQLKMASRTESRVLLLSLLLGRLQRVE